MIERRTLLGGLTAGLLLVATLSGQAGESSLDYRPQVLLQLSVTDLDRAVEFYRDVLDFRLKSRDEQLGWAKLDIGVPNVTLGVGVNPETAGSGSTSINLSVANTDAARSILEKRGVAFVGPTFTIPGVVRLATFTDPDGNRIRLAGPPDR